MIEESSKNCETCGIEFIGTKWLSNCDRCQAELERREVIEGAQRQLAKTQESARLEVAELMPPRFASTDTQDPRFNRDLWQRVKNWRPTAEKPFLGLVGEPGASKTRVAYLLLQRLIVEGCAGRVIPTHHGIDAGEFGEIVLAQFRKSTGLRDLSDTDPQGKAVANLKYLRQCDFLLFDDLGKGRTTPAVTEELFRLINHRYAHNLPTLWTANRPPEEIAAGMPDDIAGPLAGRLIECSSMPKV